MEACFTTEGKPWNVRLILRVDSTSSEHVCAGGEILQNNPKAASMTLHI